MTVGSRAGVDALLQAAAEREGVLREAALRLTFRSATDADGQPVRLGVEEVARSMRLPTKR